ncbi:MAG: hypothetical protein HYS27_14640 [Deltaproteobacteria bacterium]|nr:hypothetical protein [Deltaproteobacteria bacterium]
MRIAPSSAVVVLVLATARPALACGACFDMGLQARFWGAPAIGILAGLLFAEIVVTALVWKLMRYTPTLRRRWALLLAVVLGFAAAMLVGGSALAMGIGALLVLLPTFIRSLLREMRGSARASVLRIAGVLVVWAICCAPLLPSQRSTDSLVRLASSVSARTTPDDWVYRELRARPDTDAVLEARLDEVGDSDRGRLLTVHARLVDPAHHAALCARLLASADDVARRIYQEPCEAH